MPNIDWPYDCLVSFCEVRSGIRHVNPLIKQLLDACPASSICGMGGHSVVLQLSPDIVAKVSITPGDSRTENEQKIFELLHQSSCQHIIQCFFRGTDVSFLEYIPNYTLYDRMEMTTRGPPPVLQWMLQLSSAVACLEQLGYAHGDINPRNVLISKKDELKLVDFDHSLPTGGNLDVGQEPYVRQYRMGKRVAGGVFGVAGPRTEQYALGSMFWFMSRGTELYAEIEGPDMLERLMDDIFPDINSEDPIDRIIDNCWHGRYARVADLFTDVEGIVRCTAKQQKMEKSRICEEYYYKAKRLQNHADLDN